MPAGEGGKNTNKGGFGAFRNNRTGGRTLGNEKLDSYANMNIDMMLPLIGDDMYGTWGEDQLGAQALAQEMAFWGDVYAEQARNVDHNQQARMANMMHGLTPYQGALNEVWGEQAPQLDFSGMFTNDFKRVDPDAMRPQPPTEEPEPNRSPIEYREDDKDVFMNKDERDAGGLDGTVDGVTWDQWQEGQRPEVSRARKTPVRGGRGGRGGGSSGSSGSSAPEDDPVKGMLTGGG
jgi:hypothetical protein